MASVRTRGLGERDDADVVGRRPVEARALHEQDVLGDEEVVDELGIVADLVHVGVESRERVERALAA